MDQFVLIYLSKYRLIMIKITKAQSEALEVVKKMIVFEGKPKDWADNIFKLIYGILDIEVGTPDIVGDGTIPFVPQGPNKIGRIELTEPSTVPVQTHPFPTHPFPNITAPYMGDQICYGEHLDAKEHQTAIYDGEVKVGDWVCGATTAAGEQVSVIGSTTTSTAFMPDGGSVHHT